MMYNYGTSGQTWESNRNDPAKCPICDGTGAVYKKPEGPPTICHGCDGKGWVR